MLGGLVSWVMTDLLRATGALAPRGTAHRERDTTDGCSTAPAEAAAQTLHMWRPDGSMGTGIVNGRPGAAWGVWGRGYFLYFRPARVNLDFPWPTVILIPERKPMTWRPLCRLTPFYTPNTNSTS